MMKKLALLGLCFISVAMVSELKAQILADGEYYISLTYEPGTRIDLTGGNTNNNVNIQLWEVNDLPNQKWRVENQPDGTVVIRYAANPKYVIDNVMGTIRNANNIELFEYNGTTAQKWYISQGSPDSFYIRNAANQNYLITSGNKTPGSNIVLYENSGKPNQCWNFVSVNPNVISFKKDRNGKLDLTGHSYQCDNGNVIISIDFNSCIDGYDSLSVSSKQKQMQPGYWAIDQPARYSFDGKNFKIDYLGYYGTVSPDGKTINLNLDGNKMVFKAVR